MMTCMDGCNGYLITSVRRPASGFTILELLITMAVIGIVSAMAVPHVGNWLNRMKLRNTTVDLVFAVQQARLYAAKENRQVILTFDPDAVGSPGREYIVFVDNGRHPSSLWTREPDEFIVCAGNLPPGVEILKASFAGGIPRTRFNTMGFPNGFGGHVYMKNTTGQYMGIHVNINGNPRIVKSATGEKGTWN